MLRTSLTSVFLVYILSIPGAALADPDDLPYFVDLLKPDFDGKKQTLSEVIDEMRTIGDMHNRKRDSDKDNERSSPGQRRKLKERWLSDPGIDTDFTKNDFRDLDVLEGKDMLDPAGSRLKARTLVFDAPGVDVDSAADVATGDQTEAGDHDDWSSRVGATDDDLALVKELRKKVRNEDRKTFKNLTRQIPDILLDWVPAKPDGTTNGGFGREDDNGFPVPYKLNGWIEIERKLPWEEGS